MDVREHANNHEEALRVTLDGRQTRIWTALPGTIQSFDPDALTCTVQPSVQGRVSDPTNGSTTYKDLPLLVDCPVVFPRGGGVSLTFPIQEGDECLVVFSARCIDAWWQQSGSQPPMEARMHDLSDGFVIPGPWSQPNVISDVSTDTCQLRSDDGQTYVELDPQTPSITLQSPDGSVALMPDALTLSHSTLITLDAPQVTITQDLEVDGDAQFGGEVTGLS